MIRFDLLDWFMFVGMFPVCIVATGILWLADYEPTWMLYGVTGLVALGSVLGYLPVLYNFYHYWRRRNARC